MLSPNYGERRHGLAPDMVVLHYTAMETANAAIERLCNPVAEVSAHYVIAENGVVTQLVAESDRAWHAGAGRWGNVDDVNSHSVGIELANKGPDSDAPDYPDAQIGALQTLLAGILLRHTIAPERVIGHSDMAPTRKFDPGPYFPWRQLAGKGLSVWPKDLPTVEAQITIAQLWDVFVKDAVRFGYHAPLDAVTGYENERGWHATLRAFRTRFAMPHNEQITALDGQVIAALARDYPVRCVDGAGNAA